MANGLRNQADKRQLDPILVTLELATTELGETFDQAERERKKGRIGKHLLSEM